MDSYYHTCLHCHENIIVNESQFNTKINCSNCNNILKVPQFFKKDKLINKDKEETLSNKNIEVEIPKKEPTKKSDVYLKTHQKIDCTNCDELIFENLIICPHCNWNKKTNEFAFQDTKNLEDSNDNSLVLFSTNPGTIPIIFGTLFTFLGLWFYITFRDLEKNGGEISTYYFIIYLYQSLGSWGTTVIAFSAGFLLLLYGLSRKF